MTRLLLDTHVVFWWLMEAPLSERARFAIEDRQNDALFSMASAWEVAIKQSLGKLDPPEDFAEAAAGEGFELLRIELSHVRAVRSLPLHHRDPFDRMLVAQAQVEGLTLVTRDRRLRAYDVAVVEA